MAVTAYGVNHALAVKLWSKGLSAEILKKTWAAKFMGKGSDSIIQIKDETSKNPGDQVTFGLRMQLAGAGVVGDGTLEGNEEALVTYSDAVLINQLRHAVRSSGKMSEQRVPFDVRNEARLGLADWWADRVDSWFFNQICGNTAQTDTSYTGLNATVAPTTARHIFGAIGGALTTDETVGSATASNVFTLTHIDVAVERAKTLSPAIRPVNIGGEDKYVMFIHPYQHRSLRANTATGQYIDIQKAAMTGGQISKNPLYTGAIGEYNGVVLHESNRVTTGVNSSTAAAVTTVRRAVLCGAQAAVMAYGREAGTPQRMSWVEELFDYKNQLGVAAGCVGGLKKTVFNSTDFATITVSTSAVAG